MTLDEAKEILKMGIEPNGDLTSISEYDYMLWELGDKSINIDGNVTAEQLEAIAVYMREMSSDR